MSNFSDEKTIITTDTAKRVVQLKVNLVIENCTGEVGITDLMLQGGEVSTLYQGHPSEVRWTVDN